MVQPAMSAPSATDLEAHARGAVDRIVDRCVHDDTAGVRAVYAELAHLAAAHPELPQLRLWQSWGGFRLVSGHIEPPAAADARSVIDDLASLATSHPAEPALRELLARALAHHVHNRLQGKDVASAEAAHAELEALAAAHPREAKLQEELSHSAEALRLKDFF